MYDIFVTQNVRPELIKMLKFSEAFHFETALIK